MNSYAKGSESTQEFLQCPKKYAKMKVKKEVEK